MWKLLTEPVRVADAETSAHSRLLAGLLALLVPLGLVSNIVQLWLVPGYIRTFIPISVALFILAIAYALARLARYEAGTIVLVIAISGACLSAVAFNPNERLSPAFMLLAVLLCSVLLSSRHALQIVLVDGMVLLLVGRERLLSVPSLLASSVLFVIGSALTLLLAKHREHQEQLRQAELSDALARLRLSDRLSSIGILTAEITHEISNPLTCAQWSLELARRSEHTPGVASHLTEIHAGLDRVCEIVKGLRSIARKDEATLELVDVAAALDAAVKLTRAYVSRRAHFTYDATPVAPVLANSTKLGQIMVNLIMNAAQAIEPSARNSVVHAATSQQDDWVLVTVRDSGRGIPEHALPRIFEPFFTTKQAEDGSGLGLSIVQSIVADLHGHIQVESEVGRGTRFVVRLPAAGEARLVPAELSALSDPHLLR